MKNFSKFLVRTSKIAVKTLPQLKRVQIGAMKPFPLLSKPSFNFTIAKNHHENVLKSSYEGNGFYVQQMLVGCLAIYSYYIESNGEAFIIDPPNDISKYKQLLQERGAKLKGVFLTHYHADYIAGHNELKKQLKCDIFMGPKATGNGNLKVLKDGQQITLGNIKLEVIHTPGHTEESSCLLVHNKAQQQEVVFTGDTVFLNEVGRPDLAVKTNLTAKDLAAMLYDSIQKVKKINDNVRIYPGHGSGSSCGKSIGAGDFCDIATQKKNNYALKQQSKETFVQQVLKEMPNPPTYFAYNARLNKFDSFNYDEALKKANQHISMSQFDEIRAEDITILDIREISELNDGIIDGAICIALDGGFATWVGTLIDPAQQLVLYGKKDKVQEAIKRLLRIGYTNIRGYSTFTMQEWSDKFLPYYKPEFTDTVFEEGRYVLDVRKPAEWKQGVADTDRLVTFQLSDLFDNYEKLDKSKKYICHCKGGYRARIAYSFLKSKGFDVKAYPHSVEKIGKFRQYKA